MRRILTSIRRTGLCAAAALVFLALSVSNSTRADSDGDSDKTRFTIDGSGGLGERFDQRLRHRHAPMASSPTSGRMAAPAGPATSQADAWTFTPQHAQSLAANDPLFTPNDGSDCPPTSPSPEPEQRALVGGPQLRTHPRPARHSRHGQLHAGFRDQPEGLCDPAGLSGCQRAALPLPAPAAVDQPDLRLGHHVGRAGDARNASRHRRTSRALAPLLFDLADQANSATTGHAQGASIAGTPAQADIVAFETNLYTAQSCSFSRGKAFSPC